MVILLINTAHDPAFVLLAQGRTVLGKREWKNDRLTGQQVLSAIDELVREASIGLDDVQRIAVHVGPGGYSFLRTGVVTALMLSASSDIELVEVTGDTVEEMIEQAVSATPRDNVEPRYK